MRRHVSKVKPMKGARQASLSFGRNPTSAKNTRATKPTTAKTTQPTPASPPKFVQRRSTKVPHSARPEINGSVHVVLRIRRGLPWLRTPRTYRVLERALRAGKSKLGFRLIHYSVQRDHLHMVVETEDRRRLARAMQGLMIRIAKNLNRFWRRRSGVVFADRYFALPQPLPRRHPGPALVRVRLARRDARDLTTRFRTLPLPPPPLSRSQEPRGVSRRRRARPPGKALAGARRRMGRALARARSALGDPYGDERPREPSPVGHATGPASERAPTKLRQSPAPAQPPKPQPPSPRPPLHPTAQTPATAAATLLPSSAADTIPPAYPAPSPHGYNPATVGLASVSGSRAMRTGELVRDSTPTS